MKILVTGASGFVGRIAVEALLTAGHSVRAAVRAPQPGLPVETVVVGGLDPATDWSVALDGVQAVVHLAARVHVMRDHLGSADEFRRTNTEGTLQIARAAAKSGARRFVFVSSIKVNGEATNDCPFRADDDPHVIDAYGRSKLEAEIGLSQIAGLEPVIIRPPLVHGPGAKGNLARLCRLAQSGLPVPFDGISNRRDIVGVANLANLIERCLWHPAAPRQVFLVSDGQPLSTAQLFRLIAAAIGRPARVFNVPVELMRVIARPIGMSEELDRLTQSLEVDITKTREMLGWSPPVSTATGIEEMARAFVSGAK